MENDKSRHCKVHGNVFGKDLKINKKTGQVSCRICINIKRRENRLLKKEIKVKVTICSRENCNKPRGSGGKSKLCEQHRYLWKYFKRSIPFPVNPIPDGFIKRCKTHGLLIKDQTYLQISKKNQSKTLICKICRYELYNKNKKRYVFNAKLKKYNMSYDDYLIFLKKQNHSCAICGRYESDNTKKPLGIDHCHKTNKIRGILCTQCNTGIGMFKDSIPLLLNAIKYLSDTNSE